MAKKQKRRRSRQKSNLLPIAAIAVGVWLLIGNKGKIPPKGTNFPPLPESQNSGTGNAISLRPDRRRYINTYI